MLPWRGFAGARQGCSRISICHRRNPGWLRWRAQDGAAVCRKCLHGLHDRAESRNRPRPQVIAVAETAWNDDGIRVAQRSFLVPEQPRGVPEHIAERMNTILIAIGSGKL